MVRIASYRQGQDGDPIAVAVQEAPGAETVKARHFLERELVPRLKAGYFAKVEISETGRRWRTLTRIEGQAGKR